MWCSDDNKFLMITFFMSFRKSLLTCHLRSCLSVNFVSFFSVFTWWAYQGSDTVPVSSEGSESQCWHISCILSMIMLHNIYVYLNALSRMLSFWKSVCPHHMALFHGTTDLILIFSGWGSCSRSSLAFNVTFLVIGCPELADASLFGLSFNITVLMATFCRRFLNFVRARVHPDQLHRVSRAKHFHLNARASYCVQKYSGLWLTQCCFKVVFFGVCIRLLNLSVCQLVHNEYITCPSCFWMAMFESAAQYSKVSVSFATLHSRTSSLFAFSTTASIDAVLSGFCRRLPNAIRALAVDKLPSTVDVRAES